MNGARRLETHDPPRFYRYLGDKLTDPALKGALCYAVTRNGKCITGRSAMLVYFHGDKGFPRAVLRRRLRKVVAKQIGTTQLSELRAPSPPSVSEDGA